MTKSTDILASAPPAVRDLMHSMWADLQRKSHDAEVRRAKADPVAHKFTRTFDADARMSYRYYNAGVDGLRRRVCFCWSTERNAAGYFLGWRQVTTKRGGKRDQWTASRTRNRVKETAKRRCEKFRAR